jgi:hypothetical protein
MAYRKFDDADPKVDDSRAKVYGAFQNEAIRRAIQGVSNRVIGGTSGTQGPLVVASCAIGGSAGFKVTNAVSVVRDGVVSAVAAQDNLLFSKLGTLGTNTVAKFLICTTDGTSATCIGPGNVVSKSDYASATLAAAAAKLPDLPDGACALGYVTLNAPAATVLVLTDGATTAAAKLGYAIGGGSTAGTAAYVDLKCMPLDK